MRRYLLYVATPAQVANAKKNIKRLQATPVPDPSFSEGYQIRHSSLDGLELRLNLLDSLDAVTPHLRHFPVDMLIYDERCDGVDAVDAIEQIRGDVEQLADLWGPDFHFPMGRIVAILEDTDRAAQKTFILGRDHVRDILVDPHNIGKILRWIARILANDLRRNQYRVGVALSGGGLEGFLYQIGCCLGLEQAFTGRSLFQADVYSGVSSGAIAATMLASNVPIKEVVRSIYGRSETLPTMRAKRLYDLATADVAMRALRQSMRWAGVDPMRWLQKFVRSIPTGLFKGEGLRTYIEEALAAFGCDDQFRHLKSELLIGTTHQDTFEHVVMGKEPWEDVKISDAVRASCALPPVFTPHQIKDQSFIDGQITRTCNLELVVKRGCNLVFIIDPIRPYSTLEDGFVEQEGGIFTLIQTIKTLVHTRFRSALSHLTERYPDVDFLVFQPYEECAQIMAGSPMKFRVNERIVELAYRATLRRLRERHHVYSTKLAKFGFQLAPQRLLLEMERTGIDLS